CDVNSDCASGNCPVGDKVCCDFGCGGTCRACLGSKTGGLDGDCGLVTGGTDPDGECGADVCSGLIATCRCSDGTQNGDETGVDCGGGVCPDC
ncbi:MAG: hypothetical protein JRI23_15785, partial [Deltaproteobacteria bacterium]|nr:hypothetical protein [Deltaproteobacteria bacterium]MBW2533222.1 hypothetical protein [Deltaproteobacteria bacterium]